MVYVWNGQNEELCAVINQTRCYYWSVCSFQTKTVSLFKKKNVTTHNIQWLSRLVNLLTLYCYLLNIAMWIIANCYLLKVEMLIIVNCYLPKIAMSIIANCYLLKIAMLIIANLLLKIAKWMISNYYLLKIEMQGIYNLLKILISICWRSQHQLFLIAIYWR